MTPVVHAARDLAVSLALLCIGSIPAFAQAPDGMAIFRRQCSSCHGKQAEGGRAPNLTHSSLADSDLSRVISGGIPGTEMGAYSSRLSTAEIQSIVVFLRSAIRSDAVDLGDAARGEVLFWNKAACGNCHSVGRRGGLVGPDLSRIGRQRSAVHLRDSLISPGADIARGFDGVTVVTREGKTVRGIQRALDDFSVVLQDFSGQVYSFDRSAVRSVTRDTQSLMPGYSGTLSAAEIGDLLAYLLTLNAPRKEVQQ